MLSIWLKVIRTLFSFSTTSLSPNQILLNAFIVNFITFHLSTYQTCNIKHLTTALGKKGVSLLCTLQENVNMWWSLQLAPCCGALCSVLLECPAVWPLWWSKSWRWWVTAGWSLWWQWGQRSCVQRKPGFLRQLEEFENTELAEVIAWLCAQNQE